MGCRVMPQQVKELLGGWHVGLSKHRQLGIWNAVPHCLMWGIWRERNLRTFEGSETTTGNLKLLFFRTLFEWMQATNFFSFTTFQDFIDSCNT